MTRETCRMPRCEREPGLADGYESRRYCSMEHEVKYEHLRDDAREAAYDDRMEVREEGAGR